jgi:hypothetical protein
MNDIKAGDLVQSRANGMKVRVLAVNGRIFTGEVIDKGRAHTMKAGYKSNAFYMAMFKRLND